MKNGRVIQQGPPEELVLNPADDYVKEFTKSIPKQKVLRVSAIMGPIDKKALKDSPVKVTDTIDVVAAQVLMSDAGVAVMDESNSIVGSISRRDLVSVIT